MFDKSFLINIFGDSRANSRFFTLLFFGVLVATVGILMAIGVSVTTNYINDTTFFLEGGWRVYQGQRPHADFSSPLGPLMFLLVALGMWISGPSSVALVYMNVLVFLAVSLLAWWLGRDRMSPLLAFLFALYAGFMIAGTHIYGHPFKYLGYVVLYNRYGIALLALVLVESFLRARKYRFRYELLCGISTGVFCVLLFFLKITYFGVAFLGIIAGWFLVGRSRESWIGSLTGGFVAALSMLAYLRFDIGAIVGDLYRTIVVYSPRALSSADRIWNAGFSLTTIVSFLSLAVIVVFWRLISESENKNSRIVRGGHSEKPFSCGVWRFCRSFPSRKYSYLLPTVRDLFPLYLPSGRLLSPNIMSVIMRGRLWARACPRRRVRVLLPFPAGGLGMFL